MPKNSNKSIFDLARIYGFYESSNGINVKGKIFGYKDVKKPYTKIIDIETDIIKYAKTNSFTSKEPALVGDILITTDEKKLIVIDTVSVFTGASDFGWKINYQAVAEQDFNYPLEVENIEEIGQPEYYKALYDSKDVIKKEVIDYMNALIKTLPFWANGGGLIVPPPDFLTTMKAAKEKFEGNIETALEAEKKASY